MAREIKMRYAIDVPNPDNPDELWVNLGYEQTKKEAIAWARKHLGADAKGRINVVSKMPQD